MKDTVDIAGMKWPTVEYGGLRRPQIDLPTLIGGGYNEFWNTKKFFCVVKGSKGSKKSKTAAMKMVYLLMTYPLSNGLCIRRVKDTLLDSVFADIAWAIERMGVSHLWTMSRNPMRFKYKPTGQIILFKGMDKAEKLASITVSKGFLNYVWIEEAFELTNDEEFDKLQMSIRGILPKGYFSQIIMTFNPWSEQSWLKDMFFDHPSDDTFSDTTTFRDNEFLAVKNIKRYLDMYERNPRRARVVCDGDWGVAEGLIYENWVVDEFDIMDLKNRTDVQFVFGLDFGFSVSYTAFIAAAVDLNRREIWIYDEMYKKHKANIDLVKEIIGMGYGKEKIIADSANPQSIFEIKYGKGMAEQLPDGSVVNYMIPQMEPAVKGPDSVNNGIQRLQSFRMHVHPRCRNMIIELNTYSWEVNKDGKYTGKPLKEYDHACDALRYACTPLLVDGGGYVAEASGSDSLTKEEAYKVEKMENSRCYSTADLYDEILREREEREERGAKCAVEATCRVYSTHE